METNKVAADCGLPDFLLFYIIFAIDFSVTALFTLEAIGKMARKGVVTVRFLL